MFKFRSYILITIIATSLFSNISYSQTIDTLSKDTVLHTCGIAITFKGGTPTYFNKKKEVLKGTLAKDTRLWTNSPNLPFSADTEVEFDNKGKVISGTLDYQTIIWTADKDLDVQSGSKIKFNENGKLIFAKPVDKLIIEFAGVKEVIFSNQAYLSFDDSGKIIKGTLLEETEFPIGKTRIKFAQNTEIERNSQNLIISGTIAEKKTFKYDDGTKKQYKPGTFLRFNEQGKVEQGEQDTSEE